jgi:CBS domain-containing protein
MVSAHYPKLLLTVVGHLSLRRGDIYPITVCRQKSIIGTKRNVLMNKETVRTWMTENPITITPQTTLPEAQRVMFAYKIRRLPVMQSAKLVGIVTLGDIREAKPSDATTLSIYELNYLMDRLTAKDFMTPNPITIAPDATIAEAATLIVEHKIGALPVVEKDKLVGIITETDLCRLLMSQPELADHVT